MSLVTPGQALGPQPTGGPLPQGWAGYTPMVMPARPAKPGGLVWSEAAPATSKAASSARAPKNVVPPLLQKLVAPASDAYEGPLTPEELDTVRYAGHAPVHGMWDGVSHGSVHGLRGMSLHRTVGKLMSDYMRKQAGAGFLRGFETPPPHVLRYVVGDTRAPYPLLDPPSMRREGVLAAITRRFSESARSLKFSERTSLTNAQSRGQKRTAEHYEREIARVRRQERHAGLHTSPYVHLFAPPKPACAKKGSTKKKGSEDKKSTTAVEASEDKKSTPAVEGSEDEDAEGECGEEEEEEEEGEEEKPWVGGKPSDPAWYGGDRDREAVWSVGDVLKAIWAKLRGQPAGKPGGGMEPYEEDEAEEMVELLRQERAIVGRWASSFTAWARAADATAVNQPYPLEVGTGAWALDLWKTDFCAGEKWAADFVHGTGWAERFVLPAEALQQLNYAQRELVMRAGADGGACPAGGPRDSYFEPLHVVTLNYGQDGAPASLERETGADLERVGGGGAPPRNLTAHPAAPRGADTPRRGASTATARAGVEMSMELERTGKELHEATLNKLVSKASKPSVDTSAMTVTGGGGGGDGEVDVDCAVARLEGLCTHPRVREGCADECEPVDVTVDATWKLKAAGAEETWHRAFTYEEREPEKAGSGWAHRKFVHEFCNRGSEWAMKQLVAETEAYASVTAARTEKSGKKAPEAEPLSAWPLHAFAGTLLAGYPYGNDDPPPRKDMWTETGEHMPQPQDRPLRSPACQPGPMLRAAVAEHKRVDELNEDVLDEHRKTHGAQVR